MSEGESRAVGPEAVADGAHSSGAKRKFAHVRSIARGVGLLYSAYFFVMPIRRHSTAIWIEFALFYAVFITLFFLVARLHGRRQAVAFVLFFLLGFLYYPLNQDTAGVFVYAFAVLSLYIDRFSILFLVLLAMMAGVAAETWYFGFSLVTAEEILLFSVVIGLSNFAYAHEARANLLLERANSEIERLTQEAERERIARDLHDLLGHSLTVIAVKLDLARRLFDRDAERARNEMVEAEQTARTALADVREAVSGYRAEGLDAEIGRARRSLLSADVRMTTALVPVRLAPSQVNALCLALREAVTNVVRHAHASVCHVALSEKDGAVYCTIEDDGRGGPIREGNGLRGMRDRLRAADGTVKLTGSTHGGTSLAITLPVSCESTVQAAPQIAGEAESAR
jgi:two-component system, NarL family, sensor histidine kinase DesK